MHNINQGSIFVNDSCLLLLVRFTWKKKVQILSLLFLFKEFWQIYTWSPTKITTILGSSLAPLSSQPLSNLPQRQVLVWFFYTLVSPILEPHINEIIYTLQSKAYFTQHSVSEAHHVAHTGSSPTLAFFPPQLETQWLRGAVVCYQPVTPLSSSIQTKYLPTTCTASSYSHLRRKFPSRSAWEFYYREWKIKTQMMEVLGFLQKHVCHEWINKCGMLKPRILFSNHKE